MSNIALWYKPQCVAHNSHLASQYGKQAHLANLEFQKMGNDNNMLNHAKIRLVTG